jgi:hypothetical protein
MLTVSFQPLTASSTPAMSVMTLDTDITDGHGGRTKVPVNVKGRGVKSGILVQPEPVDFGKVLVGSSRLLDVKVTNALSVPVDIVTKVGADGKADIPNSNGAGRFEIVSPLQPSGSILPTGTMLGPNQSITISAKYTPDPAQDARQDRGRWSLANCSDPLCERGVPMLGIGTDAAIQCQPPALDFGGVNPGVTVSKPITCSNIATEAVAVTGWSLEPGTAPEFKAPRYTGTPSVLNPGDSFPVDLSFSPTQATVSGGTHPIGALLITGRNPRANRDLSPTRVALSGTPGGPRIAVAPSRLDFGQVAIGTNSKRHLLVANDGIGTLTVTMVTPDTQNTGRFTADQASGFSLDSGRSQIVTVTFTPTDTSTLSTKLAIASDDAGTPTLMVPMTGAGVTLGPCTWDVAPSSLNFGVVQLLHSASQAVRVTNRGANDCLMNSVEIVSTSTRTFTLPNGNETGIRLAPGGAHDILVQYTPQAEQTDMGQLGFYISDPNNSNPTVPLQGVGSASALVISPNELHFGKVQIGCSGRERTVTIYNTGTTPTSINMIDIAMTSSTSSSAEFRLSMLPASLPGGPASIGQGASVQFSVEFHASALGFQSGFVNIWEVGRTSPYVVPIDGQGAVDGTNEDHYTQLKTPQVDVLFVVDNSGSMSVRQTELAANFRSFIDTATSQDLDYQIAVVSTDVGDPFMSPFSPAACDNSPQRAMGLDEGRCGYFADGSWDLSATDPTWRIITSKTIPSPTAAFQALVNQGTNGEGFERGLEAAYLALTNPRIVGWNTGFIRPEAYLAIVIVSDDDDSVDDCDLGPCQKIVDPVARSTDFYINFFRSIKGFHDTSRFSLSAIVEPNYPAGVAKVGPSCPMGDGEYPGFRYTTVAQGTGGIVESICNGVDWGQSLQNLGLAVFGYKSKFFLTNTPVPGSVVVLINGVPIQGITGTGQVRWTYDPASNSVNFSPIAIPGPGSDIVIRYSAECLP